MVFGKNYKGINVKLNINLMFILYYFLIKMDIFLFYELEFGYKLWINDYFKLMFYILYIICEYGLIKCVML